MNRIAALLLLTLVLGGCGSMNPFGWLAPDEATNPPAELQPITNQLQIKRIWGGTVGSGAEDKSANLVPQIYQGRLFVASSDGLVESLDAVSGKRNWRIKTDLEISGGPGVDEGLVFVGTRNAQLVAIDMETGEERWRARVSSEVLSVPKSALGVVVVNTIDGKLFGIDKEDGSLLWLYEQPIPVLTLQGSASPVISGDRVFVGFASGKLAALDITSGAVLWESAISIPRGRSELERMVDIDGDPLVAGGAVFVNTYQGELAAVGEDSGTVFWRKELSAYSNIAADWRGLYLSDASGQVWSVEPSSGAALWKNEEFLNRGLSAPAVLADYLVVGDFEGYLHWLSADNGKLLSRVRVGSDPILAPPVVYDDRLYVYGNGGALAVFAVGDYQAPEGVGYESDYSGAGSDAENAESSGYGTSLFRDYDSDSNTFDSALPPDSKENF